MFADDTKIWRVMSKVKDSDDQQQDLEKLARWSDTWLLRFNPEKCKVMHIGHLYTQVLYGGQWIKTTTLYRQYLQKGTWEFM